MTPDAKDDWTTEAYALALAERGFCVLPLPAGTKHALSKRYEEESTRDPATIRKLWGDAPQANIGIFTGAYGDGEALLVVDIDVPFYWNSPLGFPSPTNFGYDTIATHEQEGRHFPPTFTQHTPRGGRHWIYRVPQAVNQGIGLLGFAVDLWSGDFYVVGAGSFVDGKQYAADLDASVEPAPQWLVDWCKTVRPWPQT